MKFADVIGQEETGRRLQMLVEEGRVPHALMLCGPSGSGKMALALAFASRLLCTHGHADSDACETCPQCVMLRKWEHPDLHFTFPTIKLAAMGSEHQPVSDDFAKEWRHQLLQSPYFTLSQWMTEMGAANQQAVITGAESDELLKKLSLKSSQGGYKVSIVWLPERMNLTSANKLLKLLEEPPQQTVFILVCEDPSLLLDTIKSRVQRIDVKRIATSAIEKALTEQRGLDPDTARRIARIAGGSWTHALETLDADNENRLFFDLFILLMRLAYARNIKELKRWTETVSAYGREKQKRLLTYFQRMIRENFVYNFRNADLNYMTAEEENFAKRFSVFINEANVIDISELLGRAQRDIVQNANSKIVFFDLALKLIVLLIRK